MAGTYLDNDVDPAYRLLLSDHRVVTTAEVGRRRAYDDDQLAYAASHGLVLMTHNKDDFLLLRRLALLANSLVC